MTGMYKVTNLDRNRLKEKSKIKTSDEKKVKKTLSLEKIETFELEKCWEG